MFGPHLALDCYQCDQALLEDLSLVYETLDECPDHIGMTKIMPPYVFRHDAPGGAEFGFSGFVLIAQSHISLHTFPDRGLMGADIFSCTTFDVEEAIVALKQTFQPQRVDWQILDRGSEFPRDIAGSRAEAGQERRRLATALELEAMR